MPEDLRRSPLPPDPPGGQDIMRPVGPRQAPPVNGAARGGLAAEVTAEYTQAPQVGGLF